MPKIQWTNLPPALRQHLFNRLEERQITVDDLYKLKLWRESEPEAPDGPWYKDFGSFKICGEGRFPKDIPDEGPSRQGQASLMNTPRHTESSGSDRIPCRIGDRTGLSFANAPSTLNMLIFQSDAAARTGMASPCLSGLLEMERLSVKA